MLTDLSNSVVLEAVKRELANHQDWPKTIWIKHIAEQANLIRTEWDCPVPEFSPKRVGGILRKAGILTLRTQVGYRLIISKAGLTEIGCKLT